MESKKILLVDDTVTLLKLGKAIFESAGYDVIPAADGVEALKVLEKEPVDLVVTDILMPNMDGYMLCYSIRTASKQKDIPIIIYTATYTSSSDEVFAGDIGGDLFVRKPAPAADLIAAAEKLLSAPRTGEARIPKAHHSPNLIKQYSQYSAELVNKLEERNAELEKSGEELMKANRLYAFISAINQSIVHISAKQKLLDKVCKIAIDIGRYKTVWIAMMDDADKLHILSIKGHPEMVKEIQKFSGLDFSTPQLKDTATGRVLATGNYEVKNDAQNDPDLVSFRDMLIQNNIRSTISFPISKFGKVRGVFSLQSDIQNVFDETEISLLQEAAGDISFALENLQKEKHRRKIEEQLEQNEVRLNKAQEIAHLGHWELDFHTGKSTWSDESFRIMGTTSEETEPSEEAFIAAIHPEDQSFVKNTIAETQRLRRGASFVCRIVRKDGNVRTVYTESKFEFDKLGKPARLYGIIHDITDRKEAEGKLRESEAQLKEAQALAHIGSFELDMVTNEVHWSDEMYRILGYTPGAINPSNELFFSAVHSFDIDAVNESFNNAVQNLVSGSQGFRINAADGKLKHVFVEWRKEVNATGKPLRLFGIIQDVTEKKKAEQELKKTLSEISDYKFSLDESSIVSLTDEKGIIRYANDNFCKISGYTREELLGQNHRVINSGYHDRGFFKDLWKTIAKGKVWRNEMRNMAKDGHFYWVDATIVPFLDENKKPYQYIAIRQDITERKKAEEEIRQLNANLEERVQQRTADLEIANRQLESFNYTVSHDLRSPLQVISGFCSLVMKKYKDILPADAQEKLQTVSQYTKKMASIIEDLLNLSKVHHTEFERILVDMNEQVKAVIEQLKISTENFKTEMKVANLPPAYGDKGFINHVWMNLISNAIKYSGKKETPVVEIGMKKIDGQQAYYVKDNGVGFDMKNADKLFSAFTRMHTASEFEGTGIGLSLAHSIITRHGGRIWAESNPGEGSTFYFTLPAI